MENYTRRYFGINCREKLGAQIRVGLEISAFKWLLWYASRGRRFIIFFSRTWLLIISQDRNAEWGDFWLLKGFDFYASAQVTDEYGYREGWGFNIEQILDIGWSREIPSGSAPFILSWGGGFSDDSSRKTFKTLQISIQLSFELLYSVLDRKYDQNIVHFVSYVYKENVRSHILSGLCECLIIQ